MIKTIITTITSIVTGFIALSAIYLTAGFIINRWGDRGMTIAVTVFISFLLGDIIKYLVRDAINRKKRGW